MISLEQNQDKQTQKYSLELNKSFSFYKEKRSKWFKRGEEFEMLLYNDMEGTGTQFTENELKLMSEKYTIPISINALAAITEQYQAFLTSTAPSIGVVPVGKSSKEFAYVWREIIKYTLYVNKFPRVMAQAVTDSTAVGHGIALVRPNNFFQANEFNCVIQCIPWRYLYVDPASIDQDYQDAERMFIAWPQPRSKAKKVWNLTDEQIAYACGAMEGDNSRFNNSSGIDSNGEANLWVIECYEKVKARIYVMPDGSKTFVKPPSETYIDKNGKVQKIQSYEDVFIKRVIKLGNYIADVQILPITKYPIAVYGFKHNRHPYPYGLVHDIADLQHAINKFIALTMENAQKVNNSRTYAAEGTIQDKAKWERDSSVPGVVLEYTPNTQLADGGRPITEHGTAYTSAWFLLLGEMIKFMEYVTGIFDVLQGNSENAPQTAQATSSIQNFGTQRPKMRARNYDWANQNLLETLIEFMQAFSPPENILRYSENTEAYNEIVTDIQVSLQKDEQGNVSAQEDPAGQFKATIIKQEAEKRILTILGSINEGRYRVNYQSATNLPNARQMASQVLQSIAAGVADDNIKMLLTRAILELQDYPEIDKILRDADMVQKLQGMIEQLQAKQEEQDKTINKLTSERDAAEKAARLAEWDAEADKLKHKVEAETDKLKTRVKEYEKSQSEINEYA